LSGFGFPSVRLSRERRHAVGIAVCLGWRGLGTERLMAFARRR